LATNSIAQANNLYKQGNYSDAVKIYEEILKTGISAEIYYNLGNSYYKIDEIGLAILNYERALRINPRFKDAAYNLQIAESKVVDNVNTSPTFFVKRWINGLINTSTSNQWAIISLSFFVVFLGFLLLFFFSIKRSRRKLSFYSLIIAAIISATTFYFSAKRKEQFVKHNTAIILSGAVTAKSAPDDSGTNLFQLHEGTRVSVKSTLGSWVEISLENGAVGWLEEKTLERI
jgi:tetratricopeptide (TPR) repeat protein